MRRNLVTILKATFWLSLILFGAYTLYEYCSTDDSDEFDFQNLDFVINDFSKHYVQNKDQMREYEEKVGQEYFRTCNITTPLIIWWTPFTLTKGEYKQCGAEQKTCFFTNSRLYRLNNQTSRAFLFYATDFYLHDLPLPRSSNEEWGLLHEESPKNNYLFSFSKIMEMFNHTATFKRQSDVPLITQYLTSIEDIESRQYLVSTEEKNRLQREEDLASIAYIQSDCTCPSDRDVYVRELMKYVKVDSYGKCLHNKDLPEA